MDFHSWALAKAPEGFIYSPGPTALQQHLLLHLPL
jgi:hypothetical protein